MQNKKAKDIAQKIDFEANKKSIQSLFVSAPVSTKTKDIKLKRKLKQTNSQIIDLAQATLNQQILSTHNASLLEAEGMEKTWKFSQKELSKNLDLQTKKNQFALNLQFGPYKVNYSQNSQSILLQGKKGHLAQFEHKSKKLLHQLNTQELTRDSTFLHNDTMYAVAQKKYSFIYDKTGMELHCLKDFIEVNALEYLPYHFLLASIVSSISILNALLLSSVA
jgi:U3 small nucleolar RNA-associated protein 7